MTTTLESILTQRLDTIQKIKAEFYKIEGTLPTRFRRGPIQMQVLKSVGLQRTGLNKRLVNETLEQLGYVKITIHGRLFYRRGTNG